MIQRQPIRLIWLTLVFPLFFLFFGCGNINALSILRPSGFGLGAEGLVARGKAEMRNGDLEAAKNTFAEAIEKYPGATEARLLYSQAVCNANLGDLLYFFHYVIVSSSDGGNFMGRIVDALSVQREQLLVKTFKPMVDVLEPIIDGSVTVDGRKHIMDGRINHYNINLNMSLSIAYLFRVFYLLFDSNNNGVLSESGAEGDFFVTSEAEMFGINQDKLNAFTDLSSFGEVTAPTDANFLTNVTERRKWYHQQFNQLKSAVKKLQIIKDLTENAEQKSGGYVKSTDLENFGKSIGRVTASMGLGEDSKSIIETFERMSGMMKKLDTIANEGAKTLNVAHKALFGGEFSADVLKITEAELKSLNPPGLVSPYSSEPTYTAPYDGQQYQDMTKDGATISPNELPSDIDLGDFDLSELGDLFGG